MSRASHSWSLRIEEKKESKKLWLDHLTGWGRSLREMQERNWFCVGNEDFSLDAFSIRC